MRSNVFTMVRFVAALITILAILGQPYIPHKILLIHPRASTSTSIYGPADSEGVSSVQWLDREHNYWRCNFQTRFGLDKNCGFSISWKRGSQERGRQLQATHPTCQSEGVDEDGDGWGWENGHSCLFARVQANGAVADASVPSKDVSAAKTPPCHSSDSDPDGDGRGRENNQRCRVSAPADQVPDGLDFSKYDGLIVDIDYEGRTGHLRLFMRNHNPAYSAHAANEKGKFMATYVRTDALKAGPAYISLSDFSVAEWWILEEDVPRELAGPEFNNIVSFGIDNVDFGIHKMRVNRIELVGERISRTEFLYGVLIFWVCYLLLEAWIRYYQLHRTSKYRAQQITDLATAAVSLATETSELENRSFTDPLTGIYNRNGLARQTKKLFAPNRSDEVGVLLLDIDYFKNLNDCYGHDFGDQILIAFVNLIKLNIRQDDVFARWGGEEFVILCPQASRSIVLGLGEKLRAVVASYAFESEQNIAVTISVGATVASPQDSFASIFKRVDKALYRAKINRNTFEFEV